MQNIREKEIQLLGKVLTLATSGGSTTAVDFSEQWKILIYDHEGRDIISPLLNVGALRQKGVTLHLMLHSEREAIPDAPAVYFIKPTEANIKRIAEDCAKPLYRAVYINFITKIDRPLLEKFAQELIAQNATNNIIKIYDQYLDVISLEPNLFSLNIKDSFVAFNEPSLNETQIRSFMNRVALGLLSTVRVLGALPIIRAAPGGAAEMLAHEFNQILKENISSRGPAQALFEDCLVHDRSRPLMIIMDRSNDFFPIFQHNSTYQALINELLDFKLNRVTVDVVEKGSLTSTKKKTYDLNTQNDQFLLRYASSPFPEAVDANEKELAEVLQREAAIRSRPDFMKVANSMGVDGSITSDTLNATSSVLEGKGKDLSEAIESLPEILLKKANLETHTNIMQALMKKIASREIPTYFELEQSILSSGGGKTIDRAAVISLLKDGTKGNIYDKGRLLAIVAASSDPSTLTKANNDEYDQAFTQGCQAITASNPSGSTTSSSTGTPPSNDEIQKILAAVAFIRRLLTLQSSPMLRGGFGSGGSSSSSNAILSSFLTTAQSRATSLIAKAASFFTKFTPYLITRIVHNLADGRGGNEDESYVYLDPKQTGSVPTAPPPGQKYSEVIVFVLGGGCYSEYYNLQESLKEKAGSSGGYPRHILYGCTDLVSGDEFIRQIESILPPPSSTTAATVAK